ncbi:MAG: transcriptional repressor LexA [Armatimonadota bacterium]|nr:transcriptional repressor LexA [bacterium]
MMTNELTTRQLQVLNTIRDAIVRDNRPPSIHELMRALNVASPNGIAKHLAALEAKGYIVRDQGARGIRIVDSGYAAGAQNDKHADFAYVPLIGQIAAGSPILAEEHVEETLPMPQSFTGSGGETFFLKVKGESMVEEGIMPGDLVMIEKRPDVPNGELAAVMVEDEATVKRFYRRDGMIVLEPANPNFEPIMVDPSASRCSVIGRVVGLLRSYTRKF